MKFGVKNHDTIEDTLLDWSKVIVSYLSFCFRVPILFSKKYVWSLIYLVKQAFEHDIRAAVYSHKTKKTNVNQHRL